MSGLPGLGISFSDGIYRKQSFEHIKLAAYVACRVKSITQAACC
jgi:hypothetical protein